ncbi:MAG: TipAS antibiotic-recognition domain-containing protein [Oscillibacter sp.]
MSNYHGASPEEQVSDGILVEFAAAAVSDDPAGARDLVLRWQACIAQYHNGCDDEKLARLGALYGADHRFSEQLDSYGDGTALFMSEAIAAYLESK